MAKILYCGDCGVETGFGRVAENLIPELAKKHEIHVLAVNWHGDPHPMQQYCKMYPAMVGGRDPFGSHRIGTLVQQLKPEIVWVTNDIWVAMQLWQPVKAFKESVGFKFFVYTPIDSYGLFEDLCPQLKEWDGIATYTKFARLELQKMGYDRHVDVVGHGTDFEKFFPLDKLQCRKDMGVDQDAFIVFNGNRNQPRKRIDLTLKGFAKFAKDKPDAKLWLNMGQKDMGWDLVPLFKRICRDEGCDPAGRIILSNPQFSVENCLPIDQLNKAYNCADVGVNTCIGEGWGLVNSEHGSTGVCQLVPDHTSLKEIFDGIPRIKCHGSETDRNYGLERMLPEPESMAEILTLYYNDREFLKKNGEWCKERLSQKSFTWPHIQNQFMQIFNRLLK